MKFRITWFGHCNIYQFKIKNLLLKSYCCYCGKTLIREKIGQELTPEDKEFKWFHLLPNFSIESYESYKITTYNFKCNKCDVVFNDDDLEFYRKLQKKTKIVSDRHLSDA